MVYNYDIVSFGDFRQFPVVHFWDTPLDILVLDPSIISGGQCIEAHNLHCMHTSSSLVPRPKPHLQIWLLTVHELCQKSL